MPSELEGLNIRAARLNYNLNQPILEHKVFNKAKWSPSSYLYKERLACIPYQAYYEQTPSIITKLFSKHRTNYNLGDNPNLIFFTLNRKYSIILLFTVLAFFGNVYQTSWTAIHLSKQTLQSAYRLLTQFHLVPIQQWPTTQIPLYIFYVSLK